MDERMEKSSSYSPIRECEHQMSRSASAESERYASGSLTSSASLDHVTASAARFTNPTASIHTQLHPKIFATRYFLKFLCHSGWFVYWNRLTTRDTVSVYSIIYLCFYYWGDKPVCYIKNLFLTAKNEQRHRRHRTKLHVVLGYVKNKRGLQKKVIGIFKPSKPTVK